MSIVFRAVLIIVSFLVLLFVLKKIRRSQLYIDDAIYWIVSAVLLLVLSIFPQIAIWASELFEIQSPANFVFLVMIFMILLKLFHIAIELSVQKQRINRLVQKIALMKDEEKNPKE